MLIKNISASILCFLLFSHILSAQDVDYARRIIHDLASPGMYGRGYIKKGEYKAARYISREFKSIGLDNYTRKYLQPFYISVNTFPGKVQLFLNNQMMIPGVDYLVSPESPSVKGKFNSYHIKYSDLLYSKHWLRIIGESSGKFVIIDKTLPDVEILKKEDEARISEILMFMKMHPEYPAAGTLLITNEKLTWKGSTTEGSKPFIILNTDVAPDDVKSVEISMSNVFYSSYLTHNLIGYLPGKVYPDSFIVFTAHYDHLGSMGKETCFPGANDNASGVAMLLNLAQYYSMEEHHPDYSMAFLAMGAEELGLLGAEYYTENPLFPLDQISFLINIDLAGNGEKGITVVNGSVYTVRFELLKRINEANQFLSQVKTRGAACNSDHCKFHEKSVPCFFIYTMGGSTAYHDIYDTADSLPLTMFENYFLLLKSFTDSLQVIY
jgi:aminopeptidase YwaD